MTPQELLESLKDEVNPQKRLEKLMVSIVTEIAETKAAIITLVELQKSKDQAKAAAVNTTINQFKTDHSVKVAKEPEPPIAPKQESFIKEEPQPARQQQVPQRRRRY